MVFYYYFLRKLRPLTYSPKKKKMHRYTDVKATIRIGQEHIGLLQQNYMLE